MQQNVEKRRLEKLRRSSARGQRDGGYLLLAILLMMAFLVITFAYVVGPRMVQQMKRDREEEMIHRGTEYMRAIKKFYKKNGRYPSSLDDLDKGQIRYLRQRYKDPLTKDGKWKLLSYNDIQSLLTNTAGPGIPAGALGAQGGALTPGGAVVPGGSSAAGSSGFGGSSFGNSGFGGAQQQQFQQSQQPGSITTGFATNSDQGSNQEAVPTTGDQSGNQSSFGSNQAGFGNSSSPFGSNQAGAVGGAPGSPLTSATGGQALTGTIVGVASLSKDPTIRIYNKKKTYNQWMFIYNPMMDQQNVLLRGPYQPSTTGNTNIGTPASQLNGQNGQQNGFGQQNNGFGQSGVGQQNTPQQPLQPGNSFPPEQNQQP